MCTSNYISISTEGKPGHTSIKDSFCCGLLLVGSVQRAAAGSGSCRALPKSSVKQTVCVLQGLPCSSQLQTECPLASSTCFF